MIPYRTNFAILFPKEFMVTPVHVLCSNFTEIGCREVGETMHCFADKNLAKCDSFAGLAEGTKSLSLRLPVKCRPNRFRLVGVISEKK